ncbi:MULTISPECIES: GFA family protein [unclassified Mesorhizobium]|uniref:GFA family protein n=1 Tax=unclassified Mesorhizobium TaxID=325217 RepID=UPI0003CE52B4|nr:GFA family protein [Mesorhizobium sp. LSHC420B00]ESX75561.1 aldehyde-activating protein [Mesorhizobium sp. LSHC420B00]
MSLDNRPVYTGGCQCGAVRFRVEGALGDASVCHCRMCQKASGNFYLPLVSVRGAGLDWTRGEPKRFRSSNAALRGFCAECGTPLTFEATDGVALAIAAFDHPEEIAPTIQWGVEAKLPYVDHVHELPGEETMADVSSASYLADLVSYQHPDHDTEQWPPEERS